MMKSPLKLMLFIILIFCFTAVGLEIYRFVSFQLEMEQELRSMMRDAMDLHLNDEYRNSHVSYISPGEISNTKGFIKQMLRDRYQLDSGMRQIPERDFKGAMVIPDESFMIDGGSYSTRTVTENGFTFTEPVQENNPSGEIKVLMDYKPMIFRMGDAVNTDVLQMEIKVKVEHTHF